MRLPLQIAEHATLESVRTTTRDGRRLRRARSIRKMATISLRPLEAPKRLAWRGEKK